MALFVVATIEGQNEMVNYLVVIDLGQGRFSVVLGAFHGALWLATTRQTAKTTRLNNAFLI